MLAATVRVSSKGQVVIPKEVRDSMHWDAGTELVLVSTEKGVTLQTKPDKKKKYSAESLVGFLQHKGEALSTEELCKPVEYPDDRI